MGLAPEAGHRTDGKVKELRIPDTMASITTEAGKLERSTSRTRASTSP